MGNPKQDLHIIFGGNYVSNKFWKAQLLYYYHAYIEIIVYIPYILMIIECFYFLIDCCSQISYYIYEDISQWTRSDILEK
jgi:hypothetical protein